MAKILQNSTGALTYLYQDESGMWADPDLIEVTIYDPDKVITISKAEPSYLGYGVYQYVLAANVTSKPGRYEAHWHTIKHITDITDIEYFDVVKIEDEYIITVDDVIEYIGDSTLNREFIRQLIFAFQHLAESYCSRQFKPTGIVNDRYNGDGSRKLILKNYPLLDISKLTIIEENGTFQYITERDVDHDKPEGFIAEFNEGIIYLTSKYKFLRGIENILVNYIYGYDEIPEDLKLIALEWISFKVSHRDSIGIESESLGPYRVSFDKDYLSISCKQVLNAYKRTGGL